MRSPLVVSLIYGHAEIAEYLLEHGADPNLLSDMDSMTPLQGARKHGLKALEQLLRERSARVRAPAVLAALFDCLEAGDSLDEFLEQFPTVSRDGAVQVLEASRLAQQRSILKQ